LPSESLLNLALLDSPLLAAKLFAPGCIRDLPTGLKTLDVFVSNFSQTKTLPRLVLLPNGIQSLALNLGPLRFEHLEDLRTNLKSLMELRVPITAELKQELVSTALPGVKFTVAFCIAY
jgi:hypothetical protein